MTTQEVQGDVKRPLVYTRLPTTASWVEFFYDGELYIKEGRVDDYRKEAWRIELMANRGFDYAPEPEAEPTAPENENTGQDQVVASPPTRPKKVKKEAQHGNT